MNMKKTILLTILMIFLINTHLYAEIYYIDFESGNDSNNGESVQLPWKHAPGDPQAVSIPLGTILNPGDQILFKGGVLYRGSLKMEYSGEEGLPIVYNGNSWP